MNYNKLIPETGWINRVFILEAVQSRYVFRQLVAIFADRKKIVNTLETMTKMKKIQN